MAPVLPSSYQVRRRISAKFCFAVQNLLVLFLKKNVL